MGKTRSFMAQRFISLNGRQCVHYALKNLKNKNVRSYLNRIVKCTLNFYTHRSIVPCI